MSKPAGQAGGTGYSDDLPVPNPTLYYDGDCSLCQRLVVFMQKQDRHGIFDLTPLQSPDFIEHIPNAEELRQLDTAVLATADGMVRIRSTAIVQVLRLLGGKWKAASLLLWLIPLPLRDWGYKFIARHRPRKPES
ncbi:MAG: DUF393 domain-containing protein [Planctomycetes bacterium]|nr:DUF393 domain-containing protein [Planctomycetota bacterium]